MLTMKQFEKQYCINGKKIDWDSVADVQCLDLPKALWETVFGIPMTKGKAVFGMACDYWNIDNPSWVGYKAGLNKYYFKVKNTPEFVPIYGDIAIWGGKYSKKYPDCGHIAICTGVNNGLVKFQVYQQNRTGKNEGVSKDYQTYKNDFIGVLRPYRFVRKAVNIRNMPSSVKSGTQILGELKSGSKVKIWEIKDNFAKISDTEEKWISLNYLKEIAKYE